MGDTHVDLHHGDCLEVMSSLRPGSVNFVFADLPYGITRNAWDSAIDLALFWPACWAVAHRQAVIAFTASQPFGSRLVVSQCSYFRYEVIWQKPNPRGFLNANCRPLAAHESVLLFSQATCNPNSGLRMTYNAQMTEGTPYRANRRRRIIKTNYGEFAESVTDNYEGKRHPISIQAFSSCKKIVHPTQKPVALLKWLIKTYTNPGDTVLDPVMGSGTTGVACKRLGRNFIGIEKNETYFKAAKQRIDAEPWQTTSNP